MQLQLHNNTTTCKLLRGGCPLGCQLLPPKFEPSANVVRLKLQSRILTDCIFSWVAPYLAGFSLYKYWRLPIFITDVHALSYYDFFLHIIFANRINSLFHEINTPTPHGITTMWQNTQWHYTKPQVATKTIPTSSKSV